MWWRRTRAGRFIFLQVIVREYQGIVGAHKARLADRADRLRTKYFRQGSAGHQRVPALVGMTCNHRFAVASLSGLRLLSSDRRTFRRTATPIVARLDIAAAVQGLKFTGRKRMRRWSLGRGLDVVHQRHN